MLSPKDFSGGFAGSGEAGKSVPLAECREVCPSKLSEVGLGSDTAGPQVSGVSDENISRSDAAEGAGAA